MKLSWSNVLAMVLLALSLLTVGLWVRGYVGKGGRWATLAQSRRYHFETAKGVANIGFRPNPAAKPSIDHWETTFAITVVSGTMGGRRFFQLLIPLWIPMLSFSVIPLVRAVRWYRRPAPTGICPSCGYDLRATPDRCPECGAVPAASRGEDLLPKFTADEPVHGV